MFGPSSLEPGMPSVGDGRYDGSPWWSAVIYPASQITAVEKDYIATIDAEQRMLEEQSLCYECANYHRGCNHAPFLTTTGLKKHSEGCKYREGQPTMIIQERAELRSRQVGGCDAAAVNRDKNCTIAVTLEKNMRQSGRFSEMEIIAAVTKIAGAKAVMRNDSVAQVREVVLLWLGS